MGERPLRRKETVQAGVVASTMLVALELERRTWSQDILWRHVRTFYSDLRGKGYDIMLGKYSSYSV